MKDAPNTEIDKLLLDEEIDATAINRDKLRKELLLIPGHSLALDTARPHYGIYGKVEFATKELITHAIIKSISLTMFIMMPLTAFLLLLFFYRRKYYYEHLIFSIHIHTIFFIVFSLILTIQIYISDKLGNKLWSWVFLLCLIYLIAALKYNYKQTWGKTIWKFLIMSIPYFIIRFILTLLAVLYGFLA